MGHININGCVECALPCMGASCPMRNQPVYFCDSCGDDQEKKELYSYKGKEYCIDCLLMKLKYDRIIEEV
ncbi:MAG: hypothetical protein KBS59_00210 [Clostridiales bacterium]|nr:hypothetical protein [Clostridiales bacterium]